MSFRFRGGTLAKNNAVFRAGQNGVCSLCIQYVWEIPAMVSADVWDSDYVWDLNETLRSKKGMQSNEHLRGIEGICMQCVCLV